jgi:Domain of unknown function (DUF4279)
MATDPAPVKLTVGGPVCSASATLRIFGEALEPEYISELLGCPPTGSYRKGDIVGMHTRTARREGAWFLESRLREAAPLAEQILDVLGQVSCGDSSLRELGRQFRIDMFCGIHIDGFNRGLTLPSGLLERLGAICLDLFLDIYCDDDSDVLEPTSGDAPAVT